MPALLGQPRRLALALPLLLLIPRQGGFVGGSRIRNEWRRFLGRAGSERRGQTGQQQHLCDSETDSTKNYYQHTPQHLQVGLGHRAPSCW